MVSSFHFKGQVWGWNMFGNRSQNIYFIASVTTNSRTLNKCPVVIIVDSSKDYTVVNGE